MQIRVNGQLMEAMDSLTVEGLLKELGYKDNMLAVAVNQQHVLKRLFSECILKERDDIEVLAPMAGG